MKEGNNSNPEARTFVDKLKTSLYAALVLLAMGFFAPAASYGVTLYSGSSVGSAGTVYGWGVTDATWYPYNHTAYATTRLRSPTGRTTTYSRNASTTVRVDVSLPFNYEEGNFTTTTTHKAFCSQMGWFIHGAQTSKFIEIGHSENWYQYYKYDQVLCGILKPYKFDRMIPCNSSCNSSYFCVGTWENRRLKTWYYYADIGTLRFCFLERYIGQYPIGYPGSCSDF